MKNLSIRRCFYVLAVSFVGLAASGGEVKAQKAENSLTGKANYIEEVIVTARRREESLSEVPASISVVDAEDLQTKLILSEIDLQRAAPGLIVKEALSQNQFNFAIRGQSVDPFTSSPAGVLAYVNEVQMTTVGAGSIFDLQSVQVLKGPQGTLFGRNATGGAVLFETAKPEDSFGGYLTVRGGDYDLRQLSGAVNIPIVQDRALLRIAAQSREKDGPIHNHMLNETLGDVDSSSIRGTLEIRLTDKLKNVTVVQYSEDDGTSSGGPIYSAYQCGTPGLITAADCTYGPANPGFQTFVDANPGIFPDGIYAYSQYQKQLGDFDVYHNSPSYYSGDSTYYTNTTTFEISENLLLKNIYGSIDAKIYESLDVDGTPYPLFNYGPLEASTGKVREQDQWSEELQLQGKAFDGRLEYILGAYYSDEETFDFIPQFAFDLTPVFPGGYYPLESVLDNKTKAVFFQGTYDLGTITGLDGLRFTAGYRQTWAETESTHLARSIYFGGPTLVRKFNEPSWQVGFDYSATEELLLYVVHRGSWRSGGFNVFTAPNPGFVSDAGAEFKLEKVKDYEIGAKFNGNLGGVPMRVNVAAFYQLTDDVQREISADPLGTGAPGAFTANVPESEIKGFEIDGEVSLTEWLNVGGAITYTDAKYSEPDVVINFVSYRVGPYADTPEWSGSAFARVDLPIPEYYGGLSLYGDVYSQSENYFSSFNQTLNPGTKLPSYTIANFRLDWSKMFGSSVSSAAFINNAFDEEYFTGGLANGFLFGSNVATVGHPRSWGIELRVDF